MSDTDTDDSERRATLVEPFNAVLARVQYGLLGPCVAFALLVGVGVSHYAALSVFCSTLRSAA